MSFVALDADGTLRKQDMTTVDPAGAARYLGVWFSSTAPADREHGRWSAQVARLKGMTQKFFKTCLGLSPSFSQLSAEQSSWEHPDTPPPFPREGLDAGVD